MTPINTDLDNPDLAAVEILFFFSVRSNVVFTILTSLLNTELALIRTKNDEDK